jgi:hypothetical protein
MKASNIYRKTADQPLIYVACLYTLHVTALLGYQFSTDMLINSKVCPKYFQISQVKQISLFQILDVLEEGDFIEMIHDHN